MGMSDLFWNNNGDVIWHSSITAKHSHTVESIQKRACKIILGNSYNSYESACLSLGLDSLAGRREAHCRRFADGLVDNSRTKDLLPPTRLESYGRNLRNCHDISTIPNRTNRFKNSPIPYFICLLNSK